MNLTALLVVLVFAFTLLLVFSFYAISAVVVMWAWNIFLVGVFNFPVINFIQSFALVLLLGFVRYTFTLVKLKEIK